MPLDAARAAAEPRLGRDFAALMAPLGPFEAGPTLAVGVSGGADSTALALLADDWARAQGGGIVALIVDHGIRPGSAGEAFVVRDRLTRHAIAAEILTLTGLAAGNGLQQRARLARHAALRSACRARGIVHLLLGHHADDQAETVALRKAGGSGAAGLAAMAALDENADLRVLRPHLAVPPEALRTYLRGRGEPWLDDPSNVNPAFARTRLRRDLTRDAYDRLFIEAWTEGAARAASSVALADELARMVTLSPFGFALIAGDRLSPAALAAVIRTVAARIHAPPLAAVARVAPALLACTLAGARIAPAGRWRSEGWIVLRDTPPPPVPAAPGARWGGFVLEADTLPEGLTIGARGPSSRAQRAARGLPDIVMRRLPALWADGRLVEPSCASFVFVPPRPAAGAAFVPVGSEKLRFCALEGDA